MSGDACVASDAADELPVKSEKIYTIPSVSL